MNSLYCINKKLKSIYIKTCHVPFILKLRILNQIHFFYNQVLKNLKIIYNHYSFLCLFVKIFNERRE